jgi:Arc/MetJ-type ribon-helix-helix transcriptional regulator
MKTIIQAELPDELVSQARSLVDQGWAGDFDELLADALRRHLESHSSEITESFIRQDVAWGVERP